jgi:hypothetical protein
LDVFHRLPQTALRRKDAPHKGALAPSSIQRLELVPKKLLDFLDADMFQLFESERLLFDQMIPSDRAAL